MGIYGSQNSRSTISVANALAFTQNLPTQAGAQHSEVGWTPLQQDHGLWFLSQPQPIASLKGEEK